MLLHHYHPETHEWLGAGEADEDPLEPGRWLVPRFATLDPPPPLAVGEAACFEAGTWITLADHRGATYWLADGSEHTMETLGDLPNGALDAPPPPPPPTEEDLAAAARKVWPNAGAFVADFAPQEIVAIARSGDDTLTYLDYVLKTWQGPLHSDDPSVQAAFARLLALGILTEARVTQLLAK